MKKFKTPWKSCLYKLRIIIKYKSLSWKSNLSSTGDNLSFIDQDKNPFTRRIGRCPVIYPSHLNPLSGRIGRRSVA